MPHKFHQHDADPDADDGPDPERIPDDAKADRWAGRLTPEEYVLSDPDAMASAVTQAEVTPGE